MISSGCFDSPGGGLWGLDTAVHNTVPALSLRQRAIALLLLFRVPEPNSLLAQC